MALRWLGAADLDLTNREAVAVDNAKIGFLKSGVHYSAKPTKLEALFSYRRAA
jgi:hypothetical protein